MEIVPKEVDGYIKKLETSPAIKFVIYILVALVIFFGGGWAREAVGSKQNTKEEIEGNKSELDKKEQQIIYWQKNYFDLKKYCDSVTASLLKENKLLQNQAIDILKDRIKSVKSDNIKIKKVLQ